MADEQAFDPFQTTVGDLELTVTTEHGEAVREHQPLTDQLVLEVSKSGSGMKAVFDDIVPERVDELKDAVEDIQQLIKQIEAENEREWICSTCETIVITAGGQPQQSCECGQERWQPLHEAETLSVEEEEVLKNLYVLTPGEDVAREEAADRITDASVLDQDAAMQGIDRLVEKGILIQGDGNTVQRR